MRRAGAWMRALAGLGIIGVLLWRFGSRAFLDGLRMIDVPAVLAAFAIGLATTVLSAWRWCLVARRLGLRLPLRKAVGDYYRALFLNAVLPAGVLGDVHRAVRHGREEGDVGRGVRAVVLERAAGQVVVVAIAVPVLLARPTVIPVRFREAVTVSGVVVAVVVAAALVAGRHWARGGSRWLAVSLADVRRGVLARDAWPGVVLLSVLTFAGHLALFLVAARTAGSTASFTRLLPLMVLTLLAMGLPVNIGGWGPREGVATLVFGAAGLGAERGLATAVVYGVLALVASLPGAVVLSRSYGPRAPSVERVVNTRLATVYGDLRAVGYRDRDHAREQVALLYGDVTKHGVLTRVHSECLTGDVFGSTHCECGDQLSAALRAIVAEGAGVLVYMKGHEGRGIGLLAKLEAMSLQDEGLDTVEANLALGLPIDARDYRVAAEILHDLGVRSVRLLSNNPLKLDALRRHGIRIAERVPLLIPPGGENLRYLRTKRERLDHYLPHLDVGQLSADSVSPKETTRLASTSRPFSADASEGWPTTPDSV